MIMVNNERKEDLKPLRDAFKKKKLDKFNLIKRIDNIIEEKLVQSNTSELKSQTLIYPKFHYEGRSKLSRFLFTLNQRIKILTNYLEKFYS